MDRVVGGKLLNLAVRIVWGLYRGRAYLLLIERESYTHRPPLADNLDYFPPVYRR